MLSKKNIKAGRNSFHLFLSILTLYLFFFTNLSLANNLEGNFTSIKVLDKISAKNTLIKLKNGDEKKYKSWKK